MDKRDPRCPECGGPIGLTATYCMHCSADLGDELDAADADGDGFWDPSGADDVSGEETADTSEAAGDHGGLLHPDGVIDNSLTVLVGLFGGILIGAVTLFALAAATGAA